MESMLMDLIDFNGITFRSFDLIGTLDFPFSRTIAGILLTSKEVAQYEFLVFVHFLIKMLDVQKLLTYVDIFEKRFNEKSKPKRDRDYYRKPKKEIEEYLIEICLPFILLDDKVFNRGANITDEKLQTFTIGGEEYEYLLRYSPVISRFKIIFNFQYNAKLNPYSFLKAALEKSISEGLI